MPGKCSEVLTADSVTGPAPVPVPATAVALEEALAEVLAGVVRVDRVPADADFFHDLGADSLLMAQFCARVRKRPELPAVSMKDVYRYPTVAALATVLAARATPAPSPSSTSSSTPSAAPDAAAGGVQDAASAHGAVWFVLCGVLQAALFLAYGCALAAAAARAGAWIAAGSGPLETYARSVLAASAGFAALCLLPVAAKWLLVGRFRAGRRIRVWGPGYLRFWCVRTLVRANPLVLFAGTPLYTLYLRALGARIGRGAVILSTRVPVAADLLTVGERAVVRKDVSLSCYRARAGVIETGPVAVGARARVGEQTVLDIDTAIGADAQLAHASSLHSGQSVPAGEQWHGSPAQPGGPDRPAPAAVPCGAVRRAVYGAGQVLTTVTVHLPLAFGGLYLLHSVVPRLDGLLTPGPKALTSAGFYRDAALAALVLGAAVVLLGVLTTLVLPRLARPMLRPDRVYPLYGLRHGLHRAIGRMTNRRFPTSVFGDSSAIVHYLRAVGYDLSRVRQTGSNFGTEVKHDNPYLCRVGSGTMVADGLSLINADYSATSFRLSRATIGPDNFLGNRIAYPAGGRTGGNCLLATKTLVPLDGPVREDTGLLGSPAFPIPRTVDRDNRFADLARGPALRRRLAEKNRHNAVTAAVYLLIRWLHLCGLLLIAACAAGLHSRLGAPAFALAAAAATVFTAGWFALAERAATAFRPLRPLYCSIYQRAFWRHERFWKLASVDWLKWFDGTPFKPLLLRLLGARVGRRVFDDGCFLPERSLVTIGDECTLNAGTVIQCHSQEDGAFKSDRTTLGTGCTLGVGAFVHYGVTLGDHAVLAADSFLMKGEDVPAGAAWGGNPARDMPLAGTPTPQS
ncbi:Pls/PosA family non-ribosomal peptide synthetase [Streptomyces sp. NPDC026673]|uniref:Pls/PosA family non-ribosomal peptide synthetase n=1 Tax=Streptomyces sp. NPDC026673 TaxID=3155724 RepID=UPI003406EB29